MIFEITLLCVFKLKNFTDIFYHWIPFCIWLLIISWYFSSKKPVFRKLFAVWFSQRWHRLKSVWGLILLQFSMTRFSILFRIMSNFIYSKKIVMCLLTTQSILLKSVIILTQINALIFSCIFLINCLQNVKFLFNFFKLYFILLFTCINKMHCILHFLQSFF